jgi:hypothetical protein
MSTVTFGFLFGIGFFLGIVLAVIALVAFLKALKGNSKKSYNTQKLLKAFERYRDKLQEQQVYEALPEVYDIIQHLNEGNIPPEVNTYSIEIKKDLGLKESGESSILRVIERYTVRGKLPEKK